MGEDKKRTILVADDNRNLVSLLKDRLLYEEFNVLTAYEGEKSIDVAIKKNPDLILLDICMPSGTGITVLQELRARQDTKHIPIIILTAFERPTLEKELLEAGAQLLVKKPYDMKHLIHKVHELLGESQPSGSV